jgi:hypothetical protein
MIFLFLCEWLFKNLLPKQQGKYKQHNENVKQDFGDGCCAGRNIAKAKYGSDDRNDQEDYCPAKHNFSFGSIYPQFSYAGVKIRQIPALLYENAYFRRSNERRLPPE